MAIGKSMTIYTYAKSVFQSVREVSVIRRAPADLGYDREGR